MSLVQDLPSVVLVSAVVVSGLWLSNAAYDRGVPQYVSRKIGHIFGGVALLAGVKLFSGPLWAIVLPALFGLVLLGARRVRPDTFRGVGGSGRSDKVLSEVWFALVAVPIFAVSWLWLKRPEIGLAALLFMAWGDGVTGLTRAALYRRPVKGLWGSLAMVATCLLIAWAFVTPLWVGFTAAVVAVVVERVCGDTGRITWADDNWAIALVSLMVLLSLLAVNGNL